MIPCRTQIWRPSDKAEQMWEQTWEPHWKAYAEKLGISPLNDVEKLTATANVLPFGHSTLHEFMILCWQHWWPTLQIEAQGILNDWLVRMVKAFCSEKRLTMLGCGSSGKTYIAAAYCYTMWKLRPHKTSAFLSTTSQEAGESRTWGAVKELHSMDTCRVGKRIDSLHLITLDEEVRDEEGVKQRDFKDVIKCVNIKSGQDGKNVMASIVGRKNDRVIWACDELGFMDVGVLSARVNLNTNPFNQFIGMNNAPDEGDPMYQDAEPFGPDFPDGWRSADKDIHEEWPTRSGRCFYFNGEKCPNVQAKDPTKPPFPKLMTAEMKAQILKDAGGDDTPGAWRYLFGFPPAVDIPDKVFTHKLLESNECFKDPVWADDRHKTLAGLDLGFKSGGDPSVIHFGKVGGDTRAKRILAMDPDGQTLTPSQKDSRDYEKQIAVRVIEECRKRDCHDLALDVTGDGGLMLQAIEREAREQKFPLNVLAVSFSGTAEDRIVVPGEKRTGKQQFASMVAQLWVSLRISCTNGAIRGMGPRGNAKLQLCARKGANDDKKRFTIEKKADMKKRLKRSPDHADACALLHHLALKHGLSGEQRTKKPEPFDPVKVALGAGTVPRYSAHSQTSRYGGR